MDLPCRGFGKARKIADQALLDKQVIAASWRVVLHSDAFEAAVGFSKQTVGIGHFIGGGIILFCSEKFLPFKFGHVLKPPPPPAPTHTNNPHNPTSCLHFNSFSSMISVPGELPRTWESFLVVQR